MKAVSECVSYGGPGISHTAIPNAESGHFVFEEYKKFAYFEIKCIPTFLMLPIVLYMNFIALFSTDRTQLSIGT